MKSAFFIWKVKKIEQFSQNRLKPDIGQDAMGKAQKPSNITPELLCPDTHNLAGLREVG